MSVDRRRRVAVSIEDCVINRRLRNKSQIQIQSELDV